MNMEDSFLALQHCLEKSFYNVSHQSQTVLFLKLKTNSPLFNKKAFFSVLRINRMKIVGFKASHNVEPNPSGCVRAAGFV